jgi:bacterioferritin (cytochrome b1)
MNPDRFLKDQHSRRSLFRLFGVSVAGGSAVFLSACGGDDEREGGAGSDLEILNDVLELEHAAVAAYTAGVELLRGDLLRTGRTFLEHERAHADALSSAITELGGKPNRARESYPFPDLKSHDDALRFANDVELTALAVYLDSIPKLSNGALRATAAQIATSEAEHMSVLLGALDRPQAPDAFVRGARKVTL